MQFMKVQKIMSWRNEKSLLIEIEAYVGQWEMSIILWVAWWPAKKHIAVLTLWHLRMWLYWNRDFANVIKLRKGHAELGGSKSSMIGLHRRRDEIQTQRKDSHLNTWVEIRVVCLQANDCQMRQKHQKPRERHGTDTALRESLANTLISDV